MIRPALARSPTAARHTPGGLDEFADTVVPLLQERGVFRTEYTGHTLREHLGLAALRSQATPAAS